MPIDVPVGKDAGPPSDRNIKVNIGGLHYRKLYNVIRSSMANEEITKKMHVEPSRRLWQKPNTPPNQFERIFDEVYSSDAFIEEHEKLQASPSEPECTREKVVLAMMFASDATHATNFGQAKLWPLYLMFGNISKYERCKPTSEVMEHVVFLPSVSSFLLAYHSSLYLFPSCASFPTTSATISSKKLGKAAAAPIIMHCRRELMHGIWHLLMDDEFMEAYKHGIVIKCPDGIERRFYPRIFTYSADYPEK